MLSIEINSSSLVWTFFFCFSSTLILVWYFKKDHRYWKVRGVPYIKENPLSGLWDYCFKKQPHYEVLWKKYSASPPIYGYFKSGYPFLCVRDPLIIKNILVKDFHLFPNRKNFKFGDPLTDKMLFALEGENWKRVRSILSPAFSSAKFRALFHVFNECSKIMIQNFYNVADGKQPIHMQKILSAFALDLSTSSLFSIKMDSLNYQESELVKTVTANSLGANWRFALFNFFPGLMTLFKINFFNPASCKKRVDILHQLIEERKGKKENRKDFLQYLIDSSEGNDDAKQNVKRKEDFTNVQEETSNQEKTLNNSSKKTLTMDEAVSQSLLFFSAGFSTTAGILATASYLLALHEDIQEKARQEIAKCLEETKGELTYEALKNMKYVDNVISEVLRMYPLTAQIERSAETNYELGDTGITVEKGTIISIPIYGLHHDPKYYPNPDKFDPDRFAMEEKTKRDRYVYLPFGLGPRNCIGMRYAQVQLKIGIVNVIRCFRSNVCSNTQIPIQFNGSLLFRPDPVFLTMEPTPECKLVLGKM